MQPGDHLVVSGAFGVPSLYHHGVYVGDDRVVHYWNDRGVNREKVKDPAAGLVQMTTLEEFQHLASKRGGTMRVLSHPQSTRLPNPESVRRAKLMVGTRAYDLFRNNCEHLANWAVFGIPYSSQVDYLLGDVTPRAPMKYRYDKQSKKYEFYYE
jgi:hypothetical protein